MPNKKPLPPLSAAAGTVVARTSIDAFRTEMVSGQHRWLGDEPVDVGGEDLGPSPYDFLSAALASCTTMTLKMYAAHKGLKLEAVTASVTHNKVHSSDCADCDTEAGKIDEFQREITLHGDLDEAVIARMLEIADRCPVHRTLAGEIKVRTRLAENAAG